MPSSSLSSWDSSIVNFYDVVAKVDDWSQQSPCPGWSIADLVSHTIDLEALLAADPRPDHSPDWAALPHIDSDFGRLTEIGVDFRRGLSQPDLLEDLAQTHARALERVDSLEPDASIPWLRGDTPINRLLGMRTFDIWMHEQDVRVSIGSIGNLDGPGAAEAMRYLTAGLPKVWGKATGAPIGAVLHVAITEPGLSGQFWVRVNEDGKASLVEEQTHDVSVTMPWLAFIMLAGGRTTERDYAQDVLVAGNQALGKAFLDAMAVTP